jgi:hypothetical protein
MPSTPNLQECVSVTSATSARYFDYVALHSAELPALTSGKLSQFVHNPSSLVPVVPYTLRSTKNFYDVTTNRSTALPTSRVDGFEVACVRLQCWYRAICAVRSAVRANDVVIVRPMVGQILFALVWSELRFAYTSRLARLEEVVVQVRGLINEALEDALNFCLRKEAAEARVVAYEQTMLAQARLIEEDAARAAKHHSRGNLDFVGALSDHAKQLHRNLQGQIRGAATKAHLTADDESEEAEDTAGSAPAANTKLGQRKSMFSMFKR